MKKTILVLSGLLMIFLNVVTGFSLAHFIGITLARIIAARITDKVLLVTLFYALNTFAIAGCVAGIVRGMSKIICVVKENGEKEKKAIALDLFLIITITLNHLVLQFEINIILDTIGRLAVVLALIDLIVLVISVRKGKNNSDIIDESRDKGGVLSSLIWISVPTIIVMTLLLLIVYINANIQTENQNKAIAGDFSSFTMKDLDGNEYSQDLFTTSKVTMVNIWATFCGPCINEMPELEEINKEYFGENFQIIGLIGDLYEAGEVSEEQVNLAMNIVKTTGVKYPNLIPSPEIYGGFIEKNIQAYPTTLFISDEGKIIRIVTGSRSKEDWVKIIEEVIAGEK